MKILNTEPFLCKFRGLRYLQNKMWFRDKQVHLLMTWSGSHSTRVFLRGPSWPLTDQISNLDILRCPKLAQSVIRVSWGPVVASQGQSGSIKTTLSKYEYELVYFGTPFCFVNISAPEYRAEMVLYSKFAYGSQFSGEKNSLQVMPILGYRRIHVFFWDALYLEKATVAMCSLFLY